MMKTMLPVFAALSLLAVGLAIPLEVAAQRRRAPNRAQVIRLEEVRIEGRVQKPNAFYILTRSNLGYEVLDLRDSFVREVIRSVQREPF